MGLRGCPQEHQAAQGLCACRVLSFFFFYYVCGCSEMKIPLGFFLSGLVFLSGWVCASPIILATVVSMGLVT